MIKHDKIDAGRFELARAQSGVPTTEPVKFRYDKLITGPTLQQCLVEFRTACQFPARRIDQHLGTPSCAESIVLSVGDLIPC